jgi:hypothetical protein
LPPGFGGIAGLGSAALPQGSGAGAMSFIQDGAPRTDHNGATMETIDGPHTTDPHG